MVPRRIFWLIAVAVPLVATLIWGVGLLGNFDYLNDKIIDRFFVERPVEAPVVIVAIDDRSLRTIGRWPWDRSVHAKLLNRLRLLRPAVVAFDVSFFESVEGSGDQKFAQSMRELPVILATEVGLKPLPIFLAAGADQGFVNVTLDRDGVLRRFWRHYWNDDDQLLEPSAGILGVKAFDQYCVRNAGETCETINRFWTNTNADFSGFYRIAFAGPPGHFPHYSYIDVLAGQVPDEALRNKIVLVGATALDLHDLSLAPTSQGQSMSGAEVHANIIETIWSRQFFREVGTVGHLFVVLLLALLVAYFFRRTHKISLLILMTLLLASAVTVAAAVAFEHHYIFHVVFINLVILLTFIAELSYVYFVEGKQRRFIEGAFKPYVSEKIIQIISANPKALALGGEKRLITVLFSDIRNFISISEKHDPVVLGHVLNEYFQAMSEIILAEGGLIDKFIGDAIMAIWGAPLNDEQQAERACQAALKLVQRSRELQAGFVAKGWPKIEIGIGINTGVAVVGNFGSRERFSYTAVGDTVNLASRLENANKDFGTTVIISESTKQKLPTTGYQLRALGNIKVRGKEQGVEAFELRKE